MGIDMTHNSKTTKFCPHENFTLIVCNAQMNYENKNFRLVHLHNTASLPTHPSSIYTFNNTIWILIFCTVMWLVLYNGKFPRVPLNPYKNNVMLLYIWVWYKKKKEKKRLHWKYLPGGGDDMLADIAAASSKAYSSSSSLSLDVACDLSFCSFFLGEVRWDDTAGTRERSWSASQSGKVPMTTKIEYPENNQKYPENNQK